MKKWTEQELIANGYKLINMKVTDADLSMDDHGCLDFTVYLAGSGSGLAYGGYCLGRGYVGASDDYFEGSAKGEEAIMRIMDTIGCSKMSQLKGSYVRVASKSWGDSIKIIGNIIKDKWFDYGTFFEDKK